MLLLFSICCCNFFLVYMCKCLYVFVHPLFAKRMLSSVFYSSTFLVLCISYLMAMFQYSILCLSLIIQGPFDAIPGKISLSPRTKANKWYLHWKVFVLLFTCPELGQFNFWNAFSSSLESLHPWRGCHNWVYNWNCSLPINREYLLPTMGDLYRHCVTKGFGFPFLRILFLWNMRFWKAIS